MRTRATRARAPALSRSQARAASTTASIEIDSLVDGIDCAITITRAKFDSLCDELFQRCLDTVKFVLKDAQMKQEAIAFLDGKMQSSATVMTQLMRLHQITCGHFTADDGTIKNLPCNRFTKMPETIPTKKPVKRTNNPINGFFAIRRN